MARTGSIIAAWVIGIVSWLPSAAQDSAKHSTEVASSSPARPSLFGTLARDLPALDTLSQRYPSHPLLGVLRFAEPRDAYVRNKIRDYTCTLIKRERIDGELQARQSMLLKVRHAQLKDGATVHPFAVFVRFLEPQKIADRRVVFVAGQNNGKMLVRNGGRGLRGAIVRVEPDGDAALRENLLPITEAGFDTVIRSLINQVRHDIQADPRGENTEVSFFRNARVNGRSCSHVRVVHPHPDAKLGFHLANVYVDDQLNVPVRVEVYQWPGEGEQQPRLMGEYTYVNVELNKGLSDEDFTREKLR